MAEAARHETGLEATWITAPRAYQPAGAAPNPAPPPRADPTAGPPPPRTRARSHRDHRPARHGLRPVADGRGPEGRPDRRGRRRVRGLRRGDTGAPARRRVP